MYTRTQTWFQNVIHHQTCDMHTITEPILQIWKSHEFKYALNSLVFQFGSCLHHGQFYVLLILSCTLLYWWLFICRAQTYIWRFHLTFLRGWNNLTFTLLRREVYFCQFAVSSRAFNSFKSVCEKLTVVFLLHLFYNIIYNI